MHQEAVSLLAVLLLSDLLVGQAGPALTPHEGPLGFDPPADFEEAVQTAVDSLQPILPPYFNPEEHIFWCRTTHSDIRSMVARTERDNTGADPPVHIYILIYPHDFFDKYRVLNWDDTVMALVMTVIIEHEIIDQFPPAGGAGGPAGDPVPMSRCDHAQRAAEQMANTLLPKICEIVEAANCGPLGESDQKKVADLCAAYTANWRAVRNITQEQEKAGAPCNRSAEMEAATKKPKCTCEEPPAVVCPCPPPPDD